MPRGGEGMALARSGEHMALARSGEGMALARRGDRDAAGWGGEKRGWLAARATSDAPLTRRWSTGEAGSHVV